MQPFPETEKSNREVPRHYPFNDTSPTPLDYLSNQLEKAKARLAQSERDLLIANQNNESVRFQVIELESAIATLQSVGARE